MERSENEVTEMHELGGAPHGRSAPREPVVIGKTPYKVFPAETPFWGESPGTTSLSPV